MKKNTYYAASAGCGLSGDGGVPCTFSKWMVYPSAKRIQEVLVAAGASGIKVDGIWGPCTESAYEKIFGEPLSKESLAKIGINCSTFSKTVSGTCSDGSDTVSTPQGGGTTSSVISRMRASSSSLPMMTTTTTRQTPTVVAKKSIIKPITRTSVDIALSPDAQTLIPGVPNIAVTVGGIALLGVAGWFAYKRLSK